MIPYYKGAYGVNLLFRVSGSAVYRAFPPAIVAVLIFLAIRLRWRPTEDDDHGDDLGHPYAIGVLVGSVSFLIVFRANHSYSRYWEACGATFHMASKWMDATMHMACYHLQCDHYIGVRPPSFFDYPDLNNEFLTRERERGRHPSQSMGADTMSDEFDQAPPVSDREALKLRAKSKSIERVKGRDYNYRESAIDSGLRTFMEEDPTPLTWTQRRLDGGWSSLFSNNNGDGTYFKRDAQWNADGKGFASIAGGRTPPLFLQELVHLASLLSAVALSTLRNDIEGAESPLTIYEPGSPWPEVDVTKIPRETRPNGKTWLHSLWNAMGNDRTAEARTEYNRMRPLPVLGGVSDNEIAFLQVARGPYAKTQLSWYWLSEFISREHLSGSTGKIGAPIISRVMQFMSDGMIYYNHARKIMTIPFPFPSAQLAVFYIGVIVFAVPFLMEQYTDHSWLGGILTFFTVACLAGLHEVARELEQPFRNVPNELPLVTFQAYFNESLITIMSGYHPDFYFDPVRHRSHPLSSSKRTTGESQSQTNQQQPPAGSVMVGTMPGPENESEQTETTELSQLQAMIEDQGRELERLRKIVEGRGGRKKVQ